MINLFFALSKIHEVVVPTMAILLASQSASSKIYKCKENQRNQDTVHTVAEMLKVKSDCVWDLNDMTITSATSKITTRTRVRALSWDTKSCINMWVPFHSWTCKTFLGTRSVHPFLIYININHLTCCIQGFLTTKSGPANSKNFLCTIFLLVDFPFYGFLLSIYFIDTSFSVLNLWDRCLNFRLLPIF